MVHYKLCYFNIKALAEPIRFLFNYGGIPFEDYRYEFDIWQKELKPKAPFGQGPLLEIDGKVLWQSLAIQRYVAELVGLAGKTNLEKLEIDIAVESIWDLRCLLYKYRFADEATKEKIKSQTFETQLPFIMSRLDKMVADNNGYFVNGQISWPDLAYTAYYEYLNVMAEQEIEVNCPNLKALRAKVSKIPSIKSWIDRRPKTEW